MHAWSILRVSGSDGAYRSMQVWILLRRRQSRLDATLQRDVSGTIPRKLRGRDMSVSAEHDAERHLSARSLLSNGQRVAGAMPARHELNIDGLTVIV